MNCVSIGTVRYVTFGTANLKENPLLRHFVLLGNEGICMVGMARVHNFYETSMDFLKYYLFCWCLKKMYCLKFFITKHCTRAILVVITSPNVLVDTILRQYAT